MNQTIVLTIVGLVALIAVSAIGGAIQSEKNQQELALKCIETGGQWRDDPNTWGVNMSCIR